MPALKLNPNAANVMMDLGEALIYLGRSQEAISQMERAMRRDPRHPDWFYWSLGWAHYFGGEYEDALATMSKMRRPSAMADDHVREAGLDPDEPRLAHSLRIAIDLENAQRIEVIFVPFYGGAVIHRGIGDRYQLVQPSTGDDKATHML